MKQCTKCGGKHFWKLEDGRHKCRRCSHRLTFRSAWEASRLSERTKCKLLEFFVLGVPSNRQRFRGYASKPATERFYRLIRAVLAHQENMGEPFAGAVECDETMFGGHKPGKRGWGAGGKIIVFGILKRNGKVKVFPVQGRSSYELLNKIYTHTKPGSLYYTDDWNAYASLSIRGEHIVIRKDKGKPKGRDHINGIEGFWSYAKHWLYPYRGVPRKFFHFYLGEISFRFNHRDADLYPVIYRLLKQTKVSEIAKI